MDESKDKLKQQLESLNAVKLMDSKLQNQLNSMNVKKYLTSESVLDKIKATDVTRMLPKEKKVFGEDLWKQQQEVFDMVRNQKEAEKQRELEYQEAVLNALHGIEKNTAILTEMTLLLQKSNEKQDELFQLMVEILGIMKSSTIQEAESKFATVMRKITEFTDHANTMQSLINMATSVYNAYQALPQI
ncbi:hypothetical protein SAMN05428981_11018 [Bacillus sp. OV194]|nr:hypothetical protein SAMN05428981_11018 [Bacillus sp. OV194]